MAYSMRSILSGQLKPRRVSLFEDPEHERNPGSSAESMRESSDVFIAGGETRGFRRGEQTTCGRRAYPRRASAYLGVPGPNRQSLETFTQTALFPPRVSDCPWARRPPASPLSPHA